MASKPRTLGWIGSVVVFSGSLFAATSAVAQFSAALSLQEPGEAAPTERRLLFLDAFLRDDGVEAGPCQLFIDAQSDWPEGRGRLLIQVLPTDDLTGAAAVTGWVMLFPPTGFETRSFAIAGDDAVESVSVALTDSDAPGPGGVGRRGVAEVEVSGVAQLENGDAALRFELSFTQPLQIPDALEPGACDLSIGG